MVAAAAALRGGCVSFERAAEGCKSQSGTRAALRDVFESSSATAQAGHASYLLYPEATMFAWTAFSVAPEGYPQTKRATRAPAHVPEIAVFLAISGRLGVALSVMGVGWRTI